MPPDSFPDTTTEKTKAVFTKNGVTPGDVGTYLSELRWSLADDDHAVAVYRARGSRLGRTLDIDQVLLIAHTDGVWREITAIPSDPPAFEAFWR